jgi:DNA-binding MarR family transcriptional regulator
LKSKTFSIRNYFMPTIMRRTTPAGDQPMALLEFFYPIYYKLGRALEDRLGAGRISRKQVAMLWLIRSEGERGRCLSRKRIEQLLSDWFEISSSAVTKSLRAMARPSVGLVRMVEDPRSAREKQVWLTAKGERFVAAMVGRGRQFIAAFARNFSAGEIEQLIGMFSRVNEQINANQRPEQPERGTHVTTRRDHTGQGRLPR